MITFPIDMFLPGSDIAPLEKRKQEFYDGLTHWKSAFAQAAPGVSPCSRVEGASFEEALDKANYLMITNLWGDGLPLWPATNERVDCILRGTALPRDARDRQVSAARRHHHRRDLRDRARDGGRAARVPAGAGRGGRRLPRSRIRTAEQLQAASGSAFPVVIVNGPIAQADPPEFRLRLSRSRSAASRRREHRARAAPDAAERRRRAARHRRDGQLRRHALHQRGVRRGRGESARGLAAARDRAPRFRAGAQLGFARCSRTAPPTSGGAARKRKRRRKTRCRACTAWRTSCACPIWRACGLRERHARHPHDSGRGRADHGRPRLDQTIDARIFLGALEDPARAPAPRRRPRVDRDRRESADAREPQARPVADHA